MTEMGKSWFAGFGLIYRSCLAAHAAVLPPVVGIVALSAWTMLSVPTSAKGQSVEQVAVVPAPQPPAAAQHDDPLNSAPSSILPAPPASPEQVTLAAPPAVNGLKISSQSWRRGGLGSNALITFTLRNENDYAVKDIEIACTFSRRDGSHLTDRDRLIPDAVVNMKSRKTFARVHIGYVNINANKAKCAPVAANRV